ncbi:MAG: Lytic transglycosylase [Thermoanaerobacterales bacterium 50_218]|nr:MAG: Lytic transglycosylase [Thermoanaerobacterales bacterium 50_218]HAA89685.1 transglycosylase [Peptococcaceae bacterium]
MFINLVRLRCFLLVALFLVILSIYLAQAKWFWKIFYPWPYRQEITVAAEGFQLDPYLVAAIVRVESGFNPCARSRVGALGLMQVMPETASWVAKEMGLSEFHPSLLYNSQLNLQIGCWYLAHLLEEFDGNLVVALAAYNAGRGNVHKWLLSDQWEGTAADLHKIPFRETQFFVRSVLRNHKIYRYLYE